MANTPVVKLLWQLMEIPSVSEEEHEIGVFLAQYLKSLNYTVELIPIAPNSDRCNVYAYLGDSRKARTLLTSHMDTVPPHIPFSIKGDTIFGRGACDDKGPLAAQIIALEELRADGATKAGDVSLLFVVGEEKGGPGMLAANDMNLTWEAVIFGEPTEGKLATGHKGHYVFELFATVSLLEELGTLELPTSELLGPTTFHCGKINGGVAYNVLAAEASALCGIRVAAGLASIEKKVSEVVRKYPDITLKKSFAYPETLLDHQLQGIVTNMPANLAEIPALPRDEAFAITADFIADRDPKKVSLGAGVYRDENSKPWVLPRFEPFLSVARQLILGQYDDSRSHVVSVQTISGTGANHLGAAFLAEQLKPRHVFISDPTWSNHGLVWEVAAPGVIRKTYPYYKSSKRSLDFEGMASTLERDAEEGDVIILHACAHNPTGIDPSREQWQALAGLFKRKKLFAFFDSAYQGFATGDVDADAWAVRHFQQVLFDADGVSDTPQGMCIAQSFAKNFGLYGERVGALHLVLPARTPALGSQSQLLRLVRAEMSNAPLFGCRIVHTILSDLELRTMWEQDLQTMSGRIKRMRSLLRNEIEKYPDVGDWSHLESQIGMFSYTGLSEEQVLRLREVHHVYLMLNGRASLSGVNDGNVKSIAAAISDVIRYQS
ncbi:pyridoxal phosphate-dependent transferase [Ilyonectria robusta]|uniref:pyridoxal phosphate-dependent transferase n=1 Tax=Ilyonectria robusta TaxID=1079257 RepID=UPI001E8D7524|nr:pyridoxal phosphate-dependent transferase [Ilyonectria robusta]KAH8680315.1 pyridoxal phosphate-dependent transferase [Ilyonectria robusta]